MQRIVLSVTEDKVDGRKAFLPSVNQPKQNIVFVQHLSFCANVLREKRSRRENRHCSSRWTLFVRNPVWLGVS